MKYLKKFKLLESSKFYYGPVPYVAWVRKCYPGDLYMKAHDGGFDSPYILDFSESELKVLSQKLDIEKLEIHNTDIRYPSRDKIYGSELGDGTIELYKTVDDYYFIFDQVEDQYYECDQFDGLIKCIEDNFEF